MKYKEYDTKYEMIDTVENKGYMKIMCCDCGLVHKVEFKIINGEVGVRFLRDERGTGQARRRK